MFRLQTPSLMPIMAGLLILTPLSSLVTRAAGISFPVPFHKGTVTVEEALKARCTHRSFGVRLTLSSFADFVGCLWGDCQGLWLLSKNRAISRWAFRTELKENKNGYSAMFGHSRA